MDREVILNNVREYYLEKLGNQSFDASKDYVKYAGRVFDEQELISLVDASLDFWLTEGRYSQLFQDKIANFLSVKNVILTNSGSSSNLLAISALTSKKLEDRALCPGDEVITVAAGFPATVAPIIQNNLVPVFVDVEVPSYNINVDEMHKALTPKTKAIFIAHTLGNPFNLKEVVKFAKDNNLWLVEDNCDAFGSKYDGQYTGTFGDIATFSFYPAHHITTGEGGAVVTNNSKLAKIITSFRDWGRDCHCRGGVNNTCGKRFTQQFGTLPSGYDHKYVYGELGYNLKMTDLQASIGAAQMDKIEGFGNKRRENFGKYSEMLAMYKKYLILPEATDGSDPSWFAYVVSVKEDAPFSRQDLVTYLNHNRIETRNIFAGNIIRQPAFVDQNYRVSGTLEKTDFIMNNTFFLGVYPGLTDDMFKHMDVVFKNFMDQNG